MPQTEILPNHWVQHTASRSFFLRLSRGQHLVSGSITERERTPQPLALPAL